MESGNHPIINYAQHVWAAMDARESAVLRSAIQDYLRACASMKGEIKALQEAIKAGVEERGDVRRLAAMQNLLSAVRREMKVFAEQLAENLDQALRLEIEMAGVDALGFAQLALQGMDAAAIEANWAKLNVNAIRTMFGFADQDGPLFSNLLYQFGDDVAEQVRNTLVAGFIQGMNPARVAILMAQAEGIALTWAMSMARTAMIWAYRVANHQVYLNNSDVVRAWMWFAALDERVCMSCVAKHGSKHPLTDVLMDHHQGRCIALPIMATYAELGIEGMTEEPFSVQSGEDWFKSLPQDQQIKMMGLSKWIAWQADEFEFSQLSTPYNDRVYGMMLREASLKELIGERAKLFK